MITSHQCSSWTFVQIGAAVVIIMNVAPGMHLSGSDCGGDQVELEDEAGFLFDGWCAAYSCLMFLMFLFFLHLESQAGKDPEQMASKAVEKGHQ